MSLIKNIFVISDIKMRILDTGLVIKFFKIIIFIIFIFPKINAFGAVSSLVGQKNWDNTQQRTPTGVLFNPNGTKMYSTGITQNKIYMYNLTTPFTVTTATYASKTCNLVGNNDALAFRFNSNGTAIFVLDTKTTETIDKYSLTAAYDISTCSLVAGSPQDFGGGLEMRSFAFSNDGQKIFIFDQNGNSNKHSIKQYSLSNPFDLSNPILTTEYIGHNSDLNSIEDFAQGLEFSSDGSKMFITGSKEDTILAFSLSNPFDLTATVTYDGEHIVTDVVSLGGITFSSDGSKMIVTDFNNADANRGVYQYDLTCGFGVVKCIDPTKNKDDVASIEAQSEATKKLIQHNTYPVLNRMEWLRRNSERVNLTNQNIKFQFNNAMLNSLSDTLIPLYFSNDSNDKSNYQNLSWSFWSEGTISIGNTGDTYQSSSKRIGASAITLGADKKGKDNIMRGIALRFGADDIDVGDLGSALDMSSFSLTFYESKPKGEQRFTDHLIGVSFINSDLINNSGSVSTDGDRYGEQLYGSLSLRDTLSKDQLNFTPKLKINYGITHLGAFTETGATGLNLKYDDQYIGNFTSALGTSLDKTYDFKNGSFIPYFDFEYYADMSPSSKQKFSYTSNDESFTLKNINNSTHNFISSIGFDFISENGLNLMTKYTRDQAKNNKNDSFIIALDYRVSHRSSYAMSIEDTSTKLSHNKELNGFKINLDSHYDFFKDDQDYGVNLKISNKF